MRASKVGTSIAYFMKNVTNNQLNWDEVLHLI
jgi:hypothetical protein